MIDAILGVLGMGRLYVDVTVDGAPVAALTQLCLVREDSPVFASDDATLMASIRGRALVDAAGPGMTSMLDTRGRWDGALLRAGLYRGFVRFNRVALAEGSLTEHCFAVRERIRVVAGQKTRVVAEANAPR